MSRLDAASKVRAGGTISTQQARNLHLAVQGLLRPPRARATRARLVAAIARMRLLQIDTINVVARSPYLVLFSRIGAYELRWLDEALARGRLFECWAHEACFAPIEDFALHRSQLSARANHWAYRHALRMHRDHRVAMDRLLAHVREHGAVKAADFERKEKGKGGWWGWKDEKRWLEAWFALGELMIARRENFQRVYDLRERVLGHVGPGAECDVENPAREFVLGSVRALGIAQARWIADYFRTGRKHKDDDLEALVASGDLIRVSVAGWEVPGYVHREHMALLQRARRGALRATYTTLLSPFDPVVWDRARARELFGFDYTLECYTPGHKRRYGYFVLPILSRGRLVGRLDAKAHRGDGIFEIRSVFVEPDAMQSEKLAVDLAEAIRACARWHGCARVVVRRSNPAPFAKLLRVGLKGA
jgi:uncharacterized protein